jgi:HEAT repeat protein
MVRKISHFLAALVNNASDFKRRWNQPAPLPSTANGLQGRWQGEWMSEANGHDGALRGVLTRGDSGDYKASFHAVYGGFLRVCYSVPLSGTWSDGKLKLEGEADLGPLAGGIYSYRGQADEKEFLCTYKCKYDHGTFRMKPAPSGETQSKPRRRFFFWGPLAIVLFCVLGASDIVIQRPREAYYRGRSASSWLDEFLPHFNNPQAPDASEAFNEMGTNAEPVLVAALRGKGNPFIRIYRSFWARLPESIQQHLPKTDDPELLRMAAVIVLQHSTSGPMVSDLYPMLKEPDSAFRLAILQATENQIPNADQIHWLTLAGNDPDPYLRSELWRRLNKLGAAAAPAAPYVLKFCSDTNIDVRADAAWTLWKLTGQTNTSVPVLESVLSQHPEAGQRHTAAYHLILMGDSTPVFVNTLILSLTNSQAGDRATVCSFLGEIGAHAAAAIPALRKALDDPNAEVRRRAEVALSAIEATKK